MKKPPQKLSKVTKRKPKGEVKHIDFEPGKPAPKQNHLPAPGMAPKVHPDIVDAGNELALAREKAKSAAKFAKLKESVVITKMKHHGETHYVDRGQNIEITLNTRESIGLKQFDHNDDDGDKLT